MCARVCVCVYLCISIRIPDACFLLSLSSLLCISPSHRLSIFVPLFPFALSYYVAWQQFNWLIAATNVGCFQISQNRVLPFLRIPLLALPLSLSLSSIISITNLTYQSQSSSISLSLSKTTTLSHPVSFILPFPRSKFPHLPKLSSLNHNC